MTDCTELAIAGRIATAENSDWDEAMRPWAADGGYYNFTEGPRDVDVILPPDVCDRLGEVKRKWDPDSRIVANHAVSLGEA